MTGDDKLRDLLERAINSLGLVFRQTPKSMFKVLNETENFDDLIIMCLAAEDIGLKVDEAYRLYIEESELMKKEKLEKVVSLWKRKKAPVGTVGTSIIRTMRRKKSTTKPGT